MITPIPRHAKYNNKDIVYAILPPNGESGIYTNDFSYSIDASTAYNQDMIILAERKEPLRVCASLYAEDKHCFMYLVRPDARPTMNYVFLEGWLNTGPNYKDIFCDQQTLLQLLNTDKGG